MAEIKPRIRYSPKARKRIIGAVTQARKEGKKGKALYDAAKKAGYTSSFGSWNSWRQTNVPNTKGTKSNRVGNAKRIGIHPPLKTGTTSAIEAMIEAEVQRRVDAIKLQILSIIEK